MRKIFPLERARIRKDRGCFFKRNAMLAKVDCSLPEVPGKHISVYTKCAILIGLNPTFLIVSGDL
jgi:hypothetical protein